jgi:hypothetical protein
MTLLQGVAQVLEYLKISNPKTFVFVQGLMLTLITIIEYQTDLGLTLPPLFDHVKMGIIALGYGTSSGTTNYLPPTHKKVIAIKGETEAEKEIL